MKMKLGLALAILVTLPLSNINAAPIDREVAILAAEQAQGENTQTSPTVSRSERKAKQELDAEEKRLREERRAEEKKLKEEREAARKQIEEGKKEEIKTTENRRTTSTTRLTSATTRTAERQTSNTPTSATTPDSTPSVTPATNTSNSNTNATTNKTPTTNLPNPMTPYASFEELSKAVGFTPLYLPKQSGYTPNEIYSIDNKVAEVRYGRRWEPEVLLIIRTYKRAPNEELKDISGINGVKWRIDTTANTTIYLAKVNDATNVAAWAVGDYTFAAYVENLSFAAFHTLIVDELVDLSNHYYV